MARKFPIRGEIVRLGQLLKLAGIVDGGGEVKTFLADQEVLVKGAPETHRGRRLQPGDVIRVAGEELQVTTS